MFRLSSPQYGSRYDWQLTPGIHIVGRDPQVSLMINDSTVSRRHAQIEVIDEKTVRLTDLGSLNGTQVNDARISGTVEIKPGDAITFGNVGFLFGLVGESAASSPALSITDAKEGHTSISSLPIEEALQPLPLKEYTNPTVFRAISDMAKMLILPQSVDEMFNEALDLLQEIVRAERAAILLAKESSEDVSLVAYRLKEKSSSGTFTISRSIMREVLTRKHAVLFSDLISDARFAQQQSIVVSGIRSAMAVPLINEQRVLGILYTDSSDPLQRFNEESLKVTATFGNILAAKIINHDLLEERRKKQELEQELRIASQIQEELLPKVLPDVAGYAFHAFQMQCKMVGGDLYDVAQLRDGRVLLLLADVSGKGMGAALLASNILSAFRILRDNADFDVAEATARVNSQLHNSSRLGDFATLFIGVLDPRENKLTYVNAGHNAPLLLHNDGGLEHLEAAGMPIGVVAEYTWKAKTITCDKGDRLIVFTDGIPEAFNLQGDFYSDERFEQFMLDHAADSLPAVTSALIQDVSEFLGDAPRSDDMTMILLCRV